MASLQRFLARLDGFLTRLEVAVCLASLAAMVGSLTLWVALKGLGARTTDANQAGLVFRALFGALLFGAIAWRASRRLPEQRRTILTLCAALIATALSWLWREAGIDWAGNTLGWLQDGSTFTLLGGLRGLATRLTLLLALAGAALATGAGRHVTIDVVARAMPERSRRPLSIAGGIAAALVCITSSWGFFDYISVDVFRASPAAPAIERLGTLSSGVSRHAFLLRRQFALDLRMLGPVIAGKPWDHSLTTEAWNSWIDSGSWGAHYSADQVATLHDSGSGTRVALIAPPDEAPRGLLAKSFNLIVPLGLLWLGLRFLLWALRGGPVEEAAREGAAP